MTEPHDETVFVTSPVEFKADAADESGVFSGYAAVFGNVDSHGDIMEPKAFAQSLANYERERRRPSLFWLHKNDRIIGKISSLHEDDHGLFMKAKLNLGVQDGRNAYAHIREGSAKELSIGYAIFPDGATLDRKSGIRHLTAVHVREVSLVDMASNPAARVEEFKSLASADDLERLLRAGGLAHRAAAKIAGPGFAALAGASEETELPEIDFDRIVAVLVGHERELKTKGIIK